MNPTTASLPLLALLMGCVGDKGDDTGRVSGTIDLPDSPHNYAAPELPAHFFEESMGMHRQQPVVTADNTPDDNPVTDAGATLGRVLFYDTQLSQNGTVSCASCHQAEFGFSDDRVLSEGFDGGATGRHSMSLTNARYYAPGRYFWDQRAATLEEQVLQPFQDQVEMGMTLETLVAAVEAQAFYPTLFEDAFGDSEVSSDRISKALAQFVRSMVSYESKYDEGRAQVASRGDDFPNFSDAENMGKRLFVTPPSSSTGAGCFVCHQGEAMIAVGAANNGLDADSSVDAGYGAITDAAIDMGTFKVPSLRNVAERGTFMHDGRFSSLREVVDHYSDSVQPHPNLGVPLSMHTLNFTEEQREGLVAFLETLSDPGMMQDEKFSDPFIQP